MADCRGIQRVPEWVPHSVGVLRATERFLLTGWEGIGSEQLLGSWAALSWLGAPAGAESWAPVTGAVGWPTRAQMDVEAEFAVELTDGAPYPGREWWARYNPALTAKMDEAWWNLRAGVVDAREYHHGVMIALLWVAQPGAVAPIHFAPWIRGDGEPVKRQTREWAGGKLAELWTSAARRDGEAASAATAESVGQTQPAGS